MENRCPMVEHISWEKQTSTSTAGTSTRKSTGDNASARVLVLAVVPVHTRLSFLVLMAFRFICLRRTFEPALTTNWTSLDYTLIHIFNCSECT